MKTMKKEDFPGIRWFGEVKKRNPEILSELLTLLKAIERLFIIDNLNISDKDQPNRNFFEEIIIVRDVVFIIIGMLEMIIPDKHKNSYWFRKYAEMRFLTGHLRDSFRNELYRQDSPEKSLFLLYDAFINIKTLTLDLLKSPSVPFISFRNLGDIISREIRENVYFNPFQRHFDPDFDKIENEEVSKFIRSITDRELKRSFSVIMLQFFKVLRILSYMDVQTNRQMVLNKNLALLILIRNEMDEVREYIDVLSNRVKNQDLSNFLKAISYQLTMGMKRVYFQELRDATKLAGIKRQKGRIENSYGILKNLIEQSVVQIIQFFDPHVKGNEIFNIFITRKQQSLKLREDILILHRILDNLLKTTKGDLFLKSLNALKNFMLYFQSFTFKLLRYDDYEEFVRFFEEIFKYNLNESNKESVVGFLDLLHQFKIFLETTLRQVNMREELRGEPVDEDRITIVYHQYME